jgi:hypothetical protein
MLVAEDVFRRAGWLFSKRKREEPKKEAVVLGLLYCPEDIKV